MAAGGSPHRIEELPRLGILEQIALGPGFEGVLDARPVRKRGEDEDPGLVSPAAQLASRADAIEHGHGQVHQDDVDVRVGGEQIEGFAAVAGLADDGYVLVLLEQGPQTDPHEVVVIDEQDADHGGATSGASMVRRQQVPSPGAL